MAGLKSVDCPYTQRSLDVHVLCRPGMSDLREVATGGQPRTAVTVAPDTASRLRSRRVYLPSESYNGKITCMENLPSLSNTEALILELILAHPAREAYGLEMVKASNGRLSRGSVYVMLSRMAEKNYVSSRALPPENGEGPPRRAWEVTGHGQRAFHAWQAARTALRQAWA